MPGTEPHLLRRALNGPPSYIGFSGKAREWGVQVLIHTDHHIEGHEALSAWATGEVTNALRHHSAQILRLEVHLSDENGHKSGPDDKRCLLEARLEGRQPLVVTQHAPTLYEAVNGAAEKLNRSIEGRLGRSARATAVPE